MQNMQNCMQNMTAELGVSKETEKTETFACELIYQYVIFTSNIMAISQLFTSLYIS